MLYFEIIVVIIYYRITAILKYFKETQNTYTFVDNLTLNLELKE